MSQVSHYWGVVLCSVMIVAMTGCGIRTTYDMQENFTPSTYASVQFADSTALQEKYPVVYSGLVAERVEAAVRVALVRHNIHEAADGLALVVDIAVNERTEATARGPSFSFGFGVFGSNSASRVGVGTPRDIDIDKIFDLVISLRDAQTNELLWQGVADRGLGPRYRKNPEKLLLTTATLIGKSFRALREADALKPLLGIITVIIACTQARTQ